MYGAFNGDEDGGALTHLGMRTRSSFPTGPRDSGWGTFQPFAVLVPFENGTVPSLPPRFGGPSYVTRAIPGDMRLALHRPILGCRIQGGSVNKIK